MQPLLSYLVAQAPSWIRNQREVHRASGRVLAQTEREALRGFFQPALMDQVRVVSVPMIQNPPFYADLLRAGIPIPLDFRVMAGITFVDTVLISQAAQAPESEMLPLLFHELVHSEQYRQLGVDPFVRAYVMGWASAGFSYEMIPLERDAYDLDSRFRLFPDVSFDVAVEVQRRLASRAAV